MKNINSALIALALVMILPLSGMAAEKQEYCGYPQKEDSSVVIVNKGSIKVVDAESAQAWVVKNSGVCSCFKAELTETTARFDYAIEGSLEPKKVKAPHSSCERIKNETSDLEIND
ncbi:hypothetical protein [Pseudobdellovibrio exovorus]|uniref:Uncharacterized protein n=1 Tax=Pseudobdellovibrio exovorus JSS TaxID=1184267 RepID=M4VA08_9BACT|nr:hypothetical protein [Pseudobdellovibrio exovorus]AGH94861.1 hypothetical protein A11Q_641 [Pseudobdellovibrio exovorus JSS]